VRFACFAILVLFASPAHAQDEEEDPGELLREGAALAEDGDHAAAVAYFERARVLEPGDRIDLNLASSLAELGRYAEAERLLVRLSQDESVNPLIADLAREELASVRAQMTAVDVVVSPLPQGAWLMIDGRRHSEVRAISEIHLAPGAHRLAITEGTTVLARAQLEIARGDQVRRTVRLTPVASPAALELAVQAPPPRNPRDREATREIDPWPWIGAAAGSVAATVISIVILVALTQPSHSEGDVPPIRFGGGAMP
jgi:hypothetical protein